MDISHAAAPMSVSACRSLRPAPGWLPACLLGMVLGLLLALTPAAAPTTPVQPPGPDSLSLGSILAPDPLAALALDIGEHLAAFAPDGADAAPLHPDPEQPRLCMVDDGQGFALEGVLGALVLAPSNRSTRRAPPADDFSTKHARRVERPPQQIG
jgi:hypothetical protein